MKIPLTELKDGESGIITSIGVDEEQGRERRRHCWGLKKRLEDMGLTPGAEITLFKSAPFHGPLEVSVRGSRLVIGRGVATKILVEVER